MDHRYVQSSERVHFPTSRHFDKKIALLPYLIFERESVACLARTERAACSKPALQVAVDCTTSQVQLLGVKSESNVELHP